MIATGAIIYADTHDMIPAPDPLTALYVGLALTFTAGAVVGAAAAWMVGRTNGDAATRAHGGQSGNVFFMLFGAVALVGVIGTAAMTVARGPVAGMQKVTKYTVAENDMIAASNLISRLSLSQESPDCDGDGMIEPLAFAAGTGAPLGGGLIPADVGAAKADPWGGAYGYCVWDHGQQVKAAGCGGDTARRLAGGDIADATVIALISAGPDRIFQTGCADWIDSATPTVNKATGSDDLVRLIPYGNFLSIQSAQGKLEELPEEACTPQAIGIMRLALGVVQVCLDTGWTEVGTSAFSSTDFTPVTNAVLSSQHTSNAISFSGFLNTKQLVVTEGNAILIINGTPSGTSAQIAAGDAIALSASAAATPETTLTFRISVSGVHKLWTIRTRDLHPANLIVTPNTAVMNVAGPGTPAYSSPQSFIIRNTGEAHAGPLPSTMLSNTTNFQFHSSGSYVGDDCVGKTLGYDQTCVLDLRARSSDDGAYSGNLTLNWSGLLAQAALNGSASGWSCPLPWGGTITQGNYVTAYQASSVPFGSTCSSEQRTCNGGALTGSFMFQSCAPQAPAACTLPWGGTLAHGSSVTAYQTASVPYGSSCISQSRACNNGTLSGSYTHQGCTVAPPPSGGGGNCGWDPSGIFGGC